MEKVERIIDQLEALQYTGSAEDFKTLDNLLQVMLTVLSPTTGTIDDLKELSKVSWDIHETFDIIDTGVSKWRFQHLKRRIIFTGKRINKLSKLSL